MTMEGHQDVSYELLVRGMRQDFEDKVFALQKRAEENMKAYEAYCGELKDQLEIVKLENEVLRRERRKDTGEYPALALLTSMTSLSVSCVYAGVTQRYSCGVLDGVLKGHNFILTLDQNVKAYTYDPSGSELKNFKQVAYDLADKIVFPEHMLSRFLINLLHTNYKNHDCS